MADKEICGATASGDHLIPRYGTKSLICVRERAWVEREGKRVSHSGSHLAPDDVKWNARGVQKALEEYRNRQ